MGTTRSWGWWMDLLSGVFLATGVVDESKNQKLSRPSLMMLLMCCWFVCYPRCCSCQCSAEAPANYSYHGT